MKASDIKLPCKGCLVFPSCRYRIKICCDELEKLTVYIDNDNEDQVADWWNHVRSTFPNAEAIRNSNGKFYGQNSL